MELRRLREPEANSKRTFAEATGTTSAASIYCVVLIWWQTTYVSTYATTIFA